MKKILQPPLLQVKGLTLEIDGGKHKIYPVRQVSFEIAPGETFALVGESGCGKTLTALALLGLLPPGVQQIGGILAYRGNTICDSGSYSFENIRGKHISIIFQDPRSALNPLFRIGHQLTDVVCRHCSTTRREAKSRILALFRQVGFQDPERIYASYAHQLSGGMLQRVLIAMALSCGAQMVIAEEPTTSLDVITQSMVLQLLYQLQKKNSFALFLITHDLELVRRRSDRLAIMHRGEIVEIGSNSEIFNNPQHPETRRLLEAARKHVVSRSAIPEPEISALQTVV